MPIFKPSLLPDCLALVGAALIGGLAFTSLAPQARFVASGKAFEADELARCNGAK